MSNGPQQADHEIRTGTPGPEIQMIRKCIVALFSVCVATSAVAGELTEARFRELHRKLQPDPAELWRTIPWKTSVLDAQRLAAESGKPIFLWAMDGHPLGCT